MNESVRFDNELQNLEILERDNESGNKNKSSVIDDALGTGNILCTHDGVLLKKASAEHISELNTSGSLSLVEYTAPRRLYIEWRPNDNILIADDSHDTGDWALVDTISKRVRTKSERLAFDTRSMNAVQLSNGSSEIGAVGVSSSPIPPLEPTFEKSSGGSNESNNSTGANASSAYKARVIRSNLEELCKIEIRNRGQTMRFIRQNDNSVNSEFFFQHGNADLFLLSMRNLHIIEPGPTSRHCHEYVILNTAKQELKKTFADLDIGEIKASRLDGDSWLPHKVAGFLANIPDYVNPKQPKSRPHDPDSWVIDGRGSSLDKSPHDDELENIKEHDQKIINMLPERKSTSRGSPLNQTQWLEFQTPDGRISDPLRVREVIFRGGIAHSLRCEVWKYLLNYYKWDDTEVERVQRRNEKVREYYAMKAQWLAMTPTQEENFAGYRERKSQIEKDVRRTDRAQEFFAGEDNPNLMTLQGILMTYVMYNFDLGYVQGMSDLLAPILEIEENEIDAFWCFVGFMDIVFANFDIDQAGMKTQFEQLRNLLQFVNPRLYHYMVTRRADNMYFCFRWLLVWYKREFSSDDVLKLWECLWTRLPCPNYHIFIAVAIMDQHTDIIIENRYGFTNIVKHINELTMRIDVKLTLEIAEAIYLQVKGAENVPNDIRQIIGEPLLNLLEGVSLSGDGDADFEDNVPAMARVTPEEKQRQQEEYEEACERSMFLNYH